MAYVRTLASGKYQGRYRSPDGKLRSAGTYSRKTDAKAAATAAEDAAKRGTWIDPKLRNTNFGEYATAIIENRDVRSALRTRDAYHYRNHIEPTFAHRAIGSITRGDIQAWINGLTFAADPSKKLGARTKLDVYKLLRIIMRDAQLDDLIKQSPCHHISLPRIEHVERKFLSVAEVESLADAMDPRYRAAVYVCGYLGLRWEELAALKRDRVNILKRQVLIAAVLERDGTRWVYTEDMKSNGSRRTLALPTFLAEMLAAQIGDDEFLFPAPQGGHLHYDNFRMRYWNPAVARAGLAPLGIHALRHTAAAIMIQQGANILSIQRRLGHSDVKTTLACYGHLYPEADDLLTQRLDDLGGAHVAQRGANVPQIVDIPG